MLEEEKELEYFKSAKKFLNSNPSEYDKSLEELNKITRLIKNITIIHMKALCWLMLSKFENIIEFYYVNKTHLESIFNKDYNNNSNNEKEKKEIKKIISLAFYNLGMRQKAKILCPEIKDNYKEEHFELNILQNNPINNNILLVNKDILKAGYLNSNRIDKDTLLKNIINNLDANAKNKNEEGKINLENNLNTTKDLIPISTEFVDDLFNKAIENNKLKQLENIIVPEETKSKENENQKNENEIDNKDEECNFGEMDGSIISKSSNRTNVYKKLKEEMEFNYNDIQKENGLLITFEEKMKEKKINNDNNSGNKDNEINKNNISNESIIDKSPKNNKEEEKNKPNSNLNTTKDIIPISTGFVDDLNNKAIENNKIKQLENKTVPEETISKEEGNIENNNKENNKYENKDNNNNENIEKIENKKDENEEGIFDEMDGSIISKSSNCTNVYKKLKEEIELNNNDIEKEDGLLVTFNEKIKDYTINNDENNDNKDKEIYKNETNNEDKNKNENSNRSKKSEKQKEIKGPLNIQKIPFVKKFTSDTIQVNTKLKNRKENINPESIKKDEIKEDLKEEGDEDKKEIESLSENKNESKNENKDIISTANNLQNEKIKEDEKINKEKNNDNNNIIKKSFTMNNKMNFINKDIHRIYPNLNNNDKKRNENQNDKANNKRISIDGVKSYNTYGFMNPIEFTLNPEEGASFKPISSASSQNEKNEEEKEKEDKKKEINENINLDDNIDINDKKDEIENGTNTEQNINIDKNRALLRVEIDGEQIDLVHNDNPSRRNSKYGNYINIDYTEFSNQKRKKMIEKFRDSAVKNFDIKNQTQFQKTMKLNSYNLRGLKKTKEFSINEDNEQNKTITDNSQSNLKKTCFYKTSYFLDKFDS